MCKGQQIKIVANREIVKKRNKKSENAIGKRTEKEKRTNEKKKSDTCARRDTIENKVRVKSKRVRRMSR